MNFYLMDDNDKVRHASYLVNDGWIIDPGFGICTICRETDNCTGHYGLLDIGYFIVHPLFSKVYENIISCTCSICGILLEKKNSSCDRCGKIYRYKENVKYEDVILPDKYKGLVMKYILIPPPGIRTREDVEWSNTLSDMYSRLIDMVRNGRNIEKQFGLICGVNGSTGIIDMLSGKKGIFREICYGKRIESSGRSVITGDPCIDTDQVLIPNEMANNLYIKHIITGNEPKEYAFFLQKNVPLNPYQRIPGMEVIRKIEDDDLVLINRQPTLSYGSLLSFRAKIRTDDVKTIGIHPNVTKTFNADFDGDEMNIFCFPQNSDMRKMHIKNFPCFISNIQDSITSEYLNTNLDEYGLTVSLNNLEEDLRPMVESGAKGNQKNIEQMIDRVGKQYIGGIEIGECESSYIKGLSPDEFFIHQMASREGIVGTGVNTADTGYINRKCCKIMGDIVKNGNVIEDSYGVIRFEF